jgi:Peptidase family M1 domain
MVECPGSRFEVLRLSDRDGEGRGDVVRRVPWLLAAVAFGIAAFAGRSVLALNVAEWARALDSPALGGAGVDAAGRTLTFGHLELHLASGRLYPVVAADRVVGVLFSGHGAFRYTSVDPLEAATYRTNVARNTSYEVDRDGAIGDAVSEALVWMSDGAEAIAQGQPWREGAAPPEMLARHLERFAHDDDRLPAQMLPLAILDPQARPAVVAEIEATKYDLRFTIDPFRDHDEWIDVMKPYRLSRTSHNYAYLKHRRRPVTLSDQLIDHKRLDPTPLRFLLRSLDLTLVNPGGLHADLETTETFRALAPLRVLDLILWSWQWVRTGVGLGEERHDWVIDSLTLADGQPLSFSHRNHELLVELPRTVQPGETVTLHARISGDVLFHPGNDNYWELDTTPWYPAPARLEAQRATYHAVVKVPKPYTAFSCGATLRRWEEGGLDGAEFREDRPIQFPVILAGKYATKSEERNGLTVRASSYAMADTLATKRLIDLAFTFIDFFRRYLGDYPFSELNIIEINALGFGQAPAGIVFITKEAFTPAQDALTAAFSQGVDGRLAHEIAHAWWGHVVKLSPQDQWLSESTAEFFAAYALGKLWKESAFRQKVAEWRGRSAYLKDKGTIYMANALSGERARDDRYALLYLKGPLVLDALRRKLGDRTFFTVLKSYVESFGFKVAQTRDFIDITNFITKKDYTAWFDRYLLGTQWP